MNFWIPPKAYLLLVLIASLCANEASARKWSDSTGKFSVEAEYVGVVDNDVVLKRSDGMLIRVPVARLSEADQQHLKSLAAGKAEAPARPVKEGPAALPPETKPASMENGRSTDDATQTVIAEGVGTDADEALKDAFREAVSQVVGTVVDAETLVKNDELIEDKILTYSNGFVKAYDRISEKSQAGLVRVKIRATVERRSLIAKLKAENVTLKNVDDRSLFAEAITKLEAEKGAEALLRKALEGFPDNCINAEVVGKPEIVAKDEQKATIRVKVQFKADPSACKAFGVTLQEVLEKIAQKKGAFSFVSERTRDPVSGHERFAARLPSYPLPTCWIPEDLRNVFRVRQGGHWAYNAPHIAVAMNTLTNRSGDRMEWIFYVLDENLKKVLFDLAKHDAQCKIDLLDADGKPIWIDRLVLGKDSDGPTPTLIAVAEWDGSVFTPARDDREATIFPRRTDRSAKIFFISGVFFWRDTPQRCYYTQTVTIDRDIQLALDELKAVNSIRCELQFLDPAIR